MVEKVAAYPFARLCPLYQTTGALMESEMKPLQLHRLLGVAEVTEVTANLERLNKR